MLHHNNQQQQQEGAPRAAMPQKHSKNNTDGAVFTHHERRAAGYGTQKQRLGTDSQNPFGYCCLSLKPVIDPVVSPSGHIYSRESIVEYLLTKTQELKRQKALWEAQQQGAQEEAEAAAAAKVEEEARRFIQKESAAAAAASGAKQEESKRDRVIAHALSKMDKTDRAGRREQLKRTAFWLPEFQPETKDTGIAKPDKRPKSPMSGEPLRAKDLIPLSLMADPEWTDEHDGRGKYLCAASRKPITTQPAVLIKSTGVVLLKKIAEELAYPTMTCPISGRPFSKSDVLELKSGGTGFAASGGQVEAKKHKTTHFG